MEYAGVILSASERTRRVAEAAARYAEASQRAVIIAGPNGSGKTTFAGQFLPREGECFQFINADHIAAGVSPFAPAQAAMLAGRLMLEELRRHVEKRENFAIETTLSGRRYVDKIKEWQDVQYGVKLVYLQLPDVQLAIERVARRVAEGGHDIPEAAIRRRYERGWRLFNDVYKPLVDAWALYDSSGPAARLIEQGENT